MLVTAMLRENAMRYPEQEAIVSIDTRQIDPLDEASYRAGRRALTWSGFHRLANQTANYYRSIGIGRGCKVAILLTNCLEWLPLYFGILRSGAVAVPLNFRYLSEDIVRSVRFVEADGVVFGEHCRRALEEALPQLPELRSLIYLGAEEDCPAYARSWAVAFGQAGWDEPDAALSSEDPAAIYFSSGTTGAPKAVVYTHGTLEAAWQLEHSNHHQVHEDTFVCIPPLYHVGAKLHWMGNLPVGARCVMLLGFQADVFFEALSREKITIAFLLLPWVQDILCGLSHGKLDLSRYETGSWRMLHMGAQPIPPVVVRQMQSYFPNLAYEVSYGLTESGGPGCLNLTADRMDKLGSVGLPAARWEARIVDASGGPVSPGSAGELLIRGPRMMQGYYRNPEATAAALRDGWLHTGDMAKQDGDGFYYIVGRLKDIIISGGENVYPVEVEDYLRTHPAVQDAAVFGVCDSRLGEAVAAQVELREEARCTEEELLAFCEKLPRFQRPRRIFLGEVPRNATGKIDKKALRRQYSPPHPFSGRGEAPVHGGQL